MYVWYQISNIGEDHFLRIWKLKILKMYKGIKSRKKFNSSQSLLPIGK